MSVLIKGMEMPTSCGECKLMINCDACEGWECYCTGLSNNIGFEFEIFTDKRRDDCPLVPVPPHGDLIERKAAYDSLLDGMVMTGYQSRALDCISDFCVPTIILASGGKEDE